MKCCHFAVRVTALLLVITGVKILCYFCERVSSRSRRDNFQNARLLEISNLEGAANKLNSIITDSRIVFVATVSPGTNVLPNLSPNGLIGPTTSDMTPGGSRPINHVGGDEVLYLTSGDPGKLNATLSSTNKEAPLTIGDVFSHESGHIFARWFGGNDNASSVQMENQTRRLNHEPTRTGHGEAHDVPQ